MNDLNFPWANLPREGEAKIIFVSHYYDLPRTGTAWYQDRRWYFALIEDEYSEDNFEKPTSELKYGLWDMTPEQWAQETEIRLDFNRYVGGRFAGVPLRPETEWSKYYNKWPREKFPKPDLDTRPAHVVQLSHG